MEKILKRSLRQLLKKPRKYWQKIWENFFKTQRKSWKNWENVEKKRNFF